MLASSSSFLRSLVPHLSRSLTNRAAFRPVPSTIESISTPHDFLKAIGRSSETKIDAAGWEDFWKTSGRQMKTSGVSVRDRRYILWCMEKFRNGLPIEEFVHDPRPKKTIRGWGPAVQNGKRIRSRRHKNKK